MLSILRKRNVHQKPKPKIAIEDHKPEASRNARPAFADKPWEETQATLKQDLERIRTLAGSKEKEPFKEELIKKYRPLVEKLLATHKGKYSNLDVMWWFYLWHVDLGRIEDIYDDFRSAIDGELTTPNSWKMNAQTAFLGYVFNYSHEAYKAKKEFKQDYLLSATKDLLSGELATNPPLKVKIFRLVGDWFFDAGEKERAHNLFELVMKLDPEKGGRKTKLNELREELGYDSPN